MGNAALCLARGAVVKVMLPDATIDSFDRAVQVAELVARFPNYAVVHCSTAKPSLGQLRVVIVMRMDEFLVPGHAYILYPIPKTFDESFKDTEALLNHSLDSEKVGSESTTKKGSGPITTEDLEKSLSQTLMGPAMRKAQSHVASNLLNTVEMKERKENDLVLDLSAWTPDLYQICED